MSASAVMKKFSRVVTGAAVLAAGAAFASAPAANAALFAVGDTGRWGAGGANTISNLGFNMVSLPNNPSVPGGFTSVNQISSPSNTLSFSKTVQKAYVGTDWAKLLTSRLTTGSPVYFNGGANSTTISLANAVAALDLVVETNSLAPLVFNIAVTAFGGVTQTLTQGVQGNVGGQYFGFYTTGTDLISSITITAPSGAEGFAMGEFRLGNVQAQPSAEPQPSQAVPEPTTILGTLAFGSFVAGAKLKRKQQQKKG
ncbi:PEP-CTERM sorting domain-containing protein [Kamptonema formosum]|uniref:PEP-CTERM sorting domain-containing protein n=1 Tax=Kamptonema formosum TaxID=331992 RepID=UPI000345E0F5|nr:PEP-CTERM sorting domain-containing protein [Oscillatoria sp. PCC 10802]